MQQEISKTTMIVAIVIAVVVLSGLGWWVTIGSAGQVTSRPNQSSQPPGGYERTMSGTAAQMRGLSPGATPGANGGAPAGNNGAPGQ